jgi:hypothetical protein
MNVFAPLNLAAFGATRLCLVLNCMYDQTADRSDNQMVGGNFVRVTNLATFDPVRDSRNL